MQSEELAEATQRDREVHSGDLVFSGTRVPVATVLERLEAGEPLDDILEGYPTVDRDHAQTIEEVWKELQARADAPEEARRRLVALADWSRLHAHAVELLADGQVRLSDPPTRAELIAVFDTALRATKPGWGREGDLFAGAPVEKASDLCSGERPGRGGDAEEVARIEETRHRLTDASMSLWDGADGLEGIRPVHAQHLRELRSRVDAVAANLESGPGDP